MVSSGWGTMRQMAIWCSLLHRLRECSAINLLTASKLNWVAEHFFSSVITPIPSGNRHRWSPASCRNSVTWAPVSGCRARVKGTSPLSLQHPFQHFTYVSSLCLRHPATHHFTHHFSIRIGQRVEIVAVFQTCHPASKGVIKIGLVQPMDC